MLRSLIVLFIFISNICLAHDSGHVGKAKVFDEFFHHNPYAISLQNYTTQLEQEMIKRGTHLTTQQERKIGELLIRTVQEEWSQTLARQSHQGVARQAIDFIRVHVLDRLNPVRLGKNAWKWILRKRTYVGISLIVTELIEQAAVYYAVSTGEHYWLVALSYAHVWDMVGFGIIFGAPALKNHIQLKARFGGYRNLLAHWMRHRKIMPFDWASVLNTAEVPHSTRGSTVIGIRKSTFLDRLPYSGNLKFFFNPRALAAERGALLFTISELEAICKQTGVPLEGIKAFRAEPKIYSAFLTRAITLNSAALQHIEGLIEEKMKGLPRALSQTALKPVSMLALGDQMRGRGHSPSQAAQRLRWYYQSHLDFITHMADELHSKEARKKVNRWIKHFDRAVNSQKGLKGITEVPNFVRAEENWSRVSAFATELEASLETLHRSVPQIRLGKKFSCDSLLRMR